jgi:hypothetical protein
MSERYCEKCGAKSSPYLPRKKVNGQMWCSMCALNRRSASVEMHPDLLESHRLFGSYHTTGGRVLGVHHTGASLDDQEARLAHQPGWDHQSHFEPVHFAIQGARGYASKVGLSDPHEHGYDHVRQTADRVRSIGRTYDALPDHDPASLGHFHAMGREVAHQYDHLTNHMGVKVESVDHDPYKNVHEMVNDVNANKRLKVMGTAVTGGHPFFSNRQNDQFRAVHDFFGHAATGRDFDRHGEEAAYVAHSKMFTPHARAALASETRGQNASLILNGEFGPQKVAVLPHHMYDDSSISPHIPRLGSASAPFLRSLNSLPLTALLPDGRVAVALRVGNGRICRTAHDSGDGETIFHCPFCGSGQVIARNDGSTECEFCTTAFTVQVQPQMPAFPQTIDGVPVDVPGMPNGGRDANVPPGSAPVGGDNPQDPMDPNAPDAGPGGDAEADDTQNPDDGGDDEEDDKPAFLKGSSILYRTASGRVLNETQYMRHLAINHVHDPAKVLAKIRAENVNG